MASLREVGQALKEAREAQGRTQEQIADATRISLRHLRAIEEGNESDLPEVFYVRSFLKKYADAVGLSANEVADAYRKAPTPSLSTPSMGMSLGPIVYYVGIAALVGGVLALAWHFQPRVSVVSEPSPTPAPSIKPSPKAVPVFGPTMKPAASPTPASPTPTGSAPAVAVASPTVAPSPVATAAPAASPGATATPAASPTAGVSPSPQGGRVELVIQERSWVEVRSGGKLVYEGLMRPGQRRTITGETVEVTAGNAGGVRIFVNGTDRGTLGDRGAVITKTFTP
jgi:cytoskeleton protein RodZ